MNYKNVPLPLGWHKVWGEDSLLDLTPQVALSWVPL